NSNIDQALQAGTGERLHEQAETSHGGGAGIVAASDLESRCEHWRRDQMECARVLLYGCAVAFQSQGIQTLSGRVQSVQARLHSAGILGRWERQGYFRLAHRRLCGWPAAGAILRFERR